ncbi:MAG: preprotein translocase subunit SecE, partial [Candidatus Peregrinibacteria bacterium]|nr:preprotein translocase subunit SecE [Candidatus Peregrinibacteria bacterium]
MKKSNPLTAYFVGSFEELRKVTWPTKEQAIRLTIVVLIFSLIVALALGVLDYGFSY